LIGTGYFRGLPRDFLGFVQIAVVGTDPPLIGTGYFRGLPRGFLGFVQIAVVGDGVVHTSPDTVPDEVSLSISGNAASIATILKLALNSVQAVSSKLQPNEAG
jgi:hypothetical protein